MNDPISRDELYQAIDDMFEAFSVSTQAHQGRTMDFQVWSDQYQPLNHGDGIELNPRKPAHRRFLNGIQARHVWAIQPDQVPREGGDAGRRAREERHLVPGSLRRGEPKLCVTLVPWSDADQGIVVTGYPLS